MEKSKDQIKIQAVLTLVIALALLVGWEFWAEETILVYLLDIKVEKTSFDRWEFIVACLFLVCLSMILPFKKAMLFAEELKLTQNALKGEQTLSKVFFNVDNSITLVIDTSNKIMQINQKTGKTLGFKESDLLGKDWIQYLVPEKSRETIKKEYLGFTKDRTKHFHLFRSPLKTKSGKEIFVEWQAAPLTDERGQIYGTINSGQNISDSKRLTTELIAIKNRYEPQLKKLSSEVNANKQKYHKEAIKSASSKAKFQFWFDLEKSLISLPLESLNNRQDLDKRIKATLKNFGTITGADHGHVFVFSDDQATMTNTHLWVDGEPLMEPDPDDILELESFPWFKKQILKKKEIHAPTLAKLPKEASAEKEAYLSQGVKSLISVPLVFNDTSIGYVGFESSDTEKTWDNDEIAILKVIARLLAKLIKFKPGEIITTVPADASAPPIEAPELTEEDKESLKVAQASVEEEVSKAKRQLERKLKEQIKEMEQVRKDLEKELTERKASEKELLAGRDSLEQQLSQQSLELENFRKERKIETDTEKQLEEKANEVNNRKALEAAEGKLKESERALSASREKSEQLETQLTGMESEMVALHEELENYKSQKSSTEEKLSEIQDLAKTKEKEYQILSKAHEDLTKEIKELRELEKTAQNLQSQLDEKSKTVDFQKKIIDTKERNLSQLSERSIQWEKIDLAVFALNPTGKILSWNPAAHRLTGISSENTLGKNFGSFLPNNDPNLDEQNLLSNLKKGKPLRREISLKGTQGKSTSCDLRLSPINDESGNLSGAIGYIYQVPVETREKDRRKIKDYFTSTLGNLGLYFAVLSDDYKILDFNSQTGEVFGWDREKDSKASFFSKVLAPESAQSVSKTILSQLDKESISEFETEIKSSNSKKRYFKWNLIKKKDLDGTTSRVFAMGQDITPFKSLIKSFKENEMVYQSIVEKTVDGLVTIDEHGIIQSFNPAAEQIFGYSSEEILGHNVSQLMPEPYRSEHGNYIQNYVSTGKAKIVGGPPREFIAKHKDGTSFPVEIALREMQQGYQRMFVGIVHDIRKRKELEVSLMENRAKLDRFMEIESDAILIVDPETNQIQEGNASAAELFGYDHNKLLSLKLDDISTETENLANISNGKGKHVGHTYRNPLWYFKKMDGTIFPANTTASSFLLQNRKLNLMVIRDISALKQLEERVRDSEEHLRGILNRSESAVFLKDTEGRYTLVNSHFETLFNVSNTKILGKTDEEIFPKDLAGHFRSVDRKVLERGSPIHSEESILHEDGAHTYSTVHFPLRNSSGVLYAVCGMWTDATRVKNMQEELNTVRENVEQLVDKRTEEIEEQKHKWIRSEKLESTSQMANSLATQINNPIDGIKNILQQVNDRVPMEEIHKGLVLLAMSECNRISGLVETLRECHEPALGQVSPLNLHDLIDETIKKEQENLEERIVQVEKHYATDVPPIEGVPNQLQQVIHNLLTNAEESFTEENGRILIATEREEDQIKIHIQDSGCGIPPEHLDSIFDPFFTTKSAFKRTGLGLLLSLGIIKSHYGDIDVKSQPGKGSTFTITLPLKLPN